MKKIIIFLSILVILVPMFGISTLAASDTLTVMKTAVAPIIDGELDESYKLIADSKEDVLIFEVETMTTGLKKQVQVYACWDNDYLYILVKADCNEPHVAYMDNAAEHWIFNAHYLMTAICPEDPTLEKYTGTGEDGGWSWGDLYAAQYMYEYTMIKDSKTGDNVIDNHFNSISTKAAYAYDIKSEGGYDCYEQKIPLEQLTTPAVANGVKPEEGSVLGVGFALGFSDVGTGYATKADTVDLSFYFTNKSINNLITLKLESDLAPGEESSVDESSAVSEATSEDASEPTSEDDTSVVASEELSDNSVADTASDDVSDADDKDGFEYWWLVIAGGVAVIAAVAVVIIIKNKKSV
ncbi:MAG: hypothetical protein A2Y15_07610 [Clostridiales bacterium GWF2_36_10]|nr:MAG: hypothetical protein A2Y15_07610 [Clostridiales bacterium GWF2_36_10]